MQGFGRACVSASRKQASTAGPHVTMKRALLSLLLLTVAGQPALEAAFPSPSGSVNDFVGVLDSSARAELTTLIRDTEQQTTAEIAVAVVSSLDGMTVEEYASRLFREWGVGRKAKDNGVLVLVATVDRKMRIEVGYGLEPVLPDGLAGEIIRNDFLPAFKTNHYSEGILKGVRHIADIVRAREVVTPAERRRLIAAEQDDGRLSIYGNLALLGLFIGLGAFGVGLGARTKTVGPIIMGLLFAGIPLTIALALATKIAVFTVLPIALGMLLLGHRTGRLSSWRSVLRGAGANAADDGWVAGGSTSSSGSSSSESSSSDSFGGGSSGGGGASGSW